MDPVVSRTVASGYFSCASVRLPTTTRLAITIKLIIFRYIGSLLCEFPLTISEHDMHPTAVPKVVISKATKGREGVWSLCLHGVPGHTPS
jgi:hypothetical protein